MSAPVLNPTHGTISPQQIRAIVLAGRKCKLVHGSDLTDLYSACGVDSLHALSRAAASRCIKRLSGADLPHPPGEAPREKRRPASGTFRMIDAAHLEQIERLGHEQFGSDEHFHNWLEKNFKVRDPRQLGSARRAGEVIRVLKDMQSRAAVPSRARLPLTRSVKGEGAVISTATVTERTLPGETPC